MIVKRRELIMDGFGVLAGMVGIHLRSKMPVNCRKASL